MCLSNKVKIGLIFSVLLLLAAGCAGYGSLRVECAYSDCEYEVQSLMEDFDSYHVYYAGQNPRLVSGMLFDPKDDPNKIEPGPWTIVHSREKAWSMIKVLGSYPSYRPKFSRVIGENGRMYGYLYSYVETPVKQLSPGVVKVLYIPQPPHLKHDRTGF
ncbi:MAG: hypothetical protein K9K64_10030 [Desulfohalobiaceae bacterium]|nr:hypothetical protein [Desulfohalobiaceae bacterium]